MSSERTASNKEQALDLDRLFKCLKSFVWLIVVFAIVFASVAFVFTKATFVPMYRSTARFTITPLLKSDEASGASVYSFNFNTTLAKQMASTFPHIMQSNILRDMISYDMGYYPNMSISAKAVSNTNIFELHVTSTDPEEAYKVINLLIENYPKVAEYVMGDTRMNVIEASEPEIPTKPYNTADIYKKSVVAALIGAIIGFITIYLYAVKKRVISSKRAIQIELGGNCICETSLVKKKRTSAKTIIQTGPDAAEFSESVRLLKQHVCRRLKTKENKVIGITSAIRGEGKTTIAYNLARSMSSNKHRVLLVDMDLHDRSIQNYLNRKKEVADLGICDVVASKITLPEVINSVTDSFDVLFAGTEHLKFRKSDFAYIFDYLKNVYDYIVVDLSSCNVSSETASCADLCDEILFVVKWNSTSVDKVKAAVKDISLSDTNIFGFVLNQINPDEIVSGGKYRYAHYYYGYSKRYGYGYGNRYGYGYGKRYGYGGKYHHYNYSKYGVDGETSNEASKGSKKHSHKKDKV